MPADMQTCIWRATHAGIGTSITPSKMRIEDKIEDLHWTAVLLRANHTKFEAMGTNVKDLELKIQ
jgi:hypothetical protein